MIRLNEFNDATLKKIIEELKRDTKKHAIQHAC